MSKERLFLDLHVIQTLPPSNINRDDTGSPKSAIYGGVNRSRVSSQAWKRAMRIYFGEKGYQLGVRTKYLPDLIATEICKQDSTIDKEKALEKAKAVLDKASDKFEKLDDTTKALFFIGNKQTELLADAAIKGKLTQKKIKKMLKEHPDIDIGLFGRMLAGDASLNEDASSQVAHAISTHEVATEYDYYTAVDDRKPEGSSGAAMIDTMEFNSSTLYRYANVNVHHFMEQMENDLAYTIESLKLYVEAFANSLPTGKINSYANTTVPAMLMVSLRADRPVSLVTAFEKPVRGQEGYVEKSVEKLDQEAEKVEKFVEAPIKAFYVTQEEGNFTHLGQEEASLKQLLADVEAELKHLL